MRHIEHVFSLSALPRTSDFAPLVLITCSYRNGRSRHNRFGVIIVVLEPSKPFGAVTAGAVIIVLEPSKPTSTESSNIDDSLHLNLARCEGFFATLPLHSQSQHLGVLIGETGLSSVVRIQIIRNGVLGHPVSWILRPYTGRVPNAPKDARHMKGGSRGFIHFLVKSIICLGLAHPPAATPNRSSHFHFQIWFPVGDLALHGPLASSKACPLFFREQQGGIAQVEGTFWAMQNEKRMRTIIFCAPYGGGNHIIFTLPAP